MKPTFLNREKPLLTTMIQTDDPKTAAIIARNAIWDGADAFGLQLEKLSPENRSAEVLQGIYRWMEDRPVYITNYRSGQNAGLSDEDIADGLLQAVGSGGTLFDVIGDLFCRTEGELTTDPAAVDRQKRLIDAIHEKGGEVLMSSHVLRFTPAERVAEIAFAQQERGADFAKIVTAANSEEEELENLRITALLKKELKIPYLFLSGGTHYKLHRQIGPFLGCCMWLVVWQQDAMSTAAQPVLRHVKAMAENFDWKLPRTFQE